jgi:membrane associated rhomboid family serine protease
LATCYRHPSRETGVSCSNCGNPICPDCMTPTPVGMRCPNCAKQKTQVRTLGSLHAEPRVTYAVIVLCVIAFLGSGSFGVASESANSLGDRGQLTALGIYQDELYRLVTSGFLHAGLLHIGFNMYLLYLLGPQLEGSLGSVRFGALYVTSLLVGAVGALLQQDNPLQGTVGASGAIFGLMGAVAMQMRAQGLDPLRSDIGVLIGFNLVLGFVLPRVSWGGHLGGLVGGIVVMAIFTALARRRAPSWVGVAACVGISAAAVAACVLVADQKVEDALRAVGAG